MLRRLRPALAVAALCSAAGVADAQRTGGFETGGSAFGSQNFGGGLSSGLGGGFGGSSLGGGGVGGSSLGGGVGGSSLGGGGFGGGSTAGLGGAFGGGTLFTGAGAGGPVFIGSGVGTSPFLGAGGLYATGGGVGASGFGGGFGNTGFGGGFGNSGLGGGFGNAGFGGGGFGGGGFGAGPARTGAAAAGSDPRLSINVPLRLGFAAPVRPAANIGAAYAARTSFLAAQTGRTARPGLAGVRAAMGDDGVVTLSGNVPAADRRLAAALARLEPGVRDVREAYDIAEPAAAGAILPGAPPAPPARPGQVEAIAAPEPLPDTPLLRQTENIVPLRVLNP